MAYENIVVKTNGKVGLTVLNRPAQLNALNDDLVDELARAPDAFESDENIGCMVITGSDKAFAAGADISAKAMDMCLTARFIDAAEAERAG